jgi:hypothetical protein
MTYKQIALADPDNYSESMIWRALNRRPSRAKKPKTTKLAYGLARGAGCLSDRTDVGSPYAVVSFGARDGADGLDERYNRADAEAAAAKAARKPGRHRVLIVDTRVQGTHRDASASAGLEAMLNLMHAEAARGQAERRRAQQRAGGIVVKRVTEAPTIPQQRGGGRSQYASHRWPDPEDNPWRNVNWDDQVAKLKALLKILYEPPIGAP